jgi:hypothetical protein
MLTFFIKYIIKYLNSTFFIVISCKKKLNNFLKFIKFNFIVVFILIANLGSCGFQVVYKDQYLSSSISNELAAIKISKDRTQLAQQLRNNLYDVLNPDYIKTQNKYFLILKIQESISPTFITSTGASGRNKTTIKVDYQLKNSENMQEISRGTVDISDNYDVTTNRYATYVAEQYIKNNLTKLLAQSLRNSVINDLIQFQKRCIDQNKIDDDSICKFSNNSDLK